MPQPKIKFRHSNVKTYPGTTQNNYVGAQSVAGRRGTLPTFTDGNTKYVDSVNGSDVVTIAASTSALWKFERDYGQDYSGSYLSLNNVGVVPYQSVASISTLNSVPPGRYAVGPFSNTNYLTFPTGLQTLLNAATVYSFEFYLCVDSGIVAQENIVYIEQSGATPRTVMYAINSGGGFKLGWNINGINVITSTSVLTLGTWYKVSYVNNAGATNKRVIYVDTVSQATDTTSATLGTLTAGGGVIGNNTTPNAPGLHIHLKQMRVSAGTARTSAFTVDVNTNTGATASPFQSINFALSQIDNTNMSTFLYVVAKDNATYNEQLDIWQTNLGLYALDGKTPTISATRGATGGTYGARTSGRVYSYASPPPGLAVGAGTTWYVAKTGTDASGGTHGQVGNPFLTIAYAITQAVSGDCINISDSNTYTETLTFGAKVITLQSTSGQLPTLKSSNITSNAGVAFNLFGLNFSNSTTAIATCAATSTSGSQTAFYIYDCTFSTNRTAICITSSNNALLQIVNCFFNNFTQGVVGTWNTVVRNCFFSNNLSGSTVITASGNFYDLRFNTFSNVYKAITGTSVAAAKSTIHSSAFLNTSSNACSFETTAIGKGALLQNCYFYKTLDFAILTAHVATIDECLFSSCAGAVKATSTASSTSTQAQLLSNIICLDSTSTTGDVLLKNGGFVANIEYVVQSATFVNSAYAAIVVDGASVAGGATTAVTAIGIIEYNSATYSIAAINQGATGSLTFARYQSCVLQKATNGSTTLLTGNYFATDAKLISTVAGSEKVGISPNSAGILNFTTSLGVLPTVYGGYALWTMPALLDSGVAGHQVYLDGPGTAVNGFIFNDPNNLLNSIITNQALATACSVGFCTLNSCGSYSISVASQSSVSNCLFSNVTGLEIVESGSTISNNAFSSCAGAAIINTALSTIKNNSAVGCQYGQYDLGVGTGTYSNNIYSSSGVYDYSGNNTQTYSCIGALDPATLAAVDSHSFRTNPLFRDLASSTLDLRLQVIAASSGSTVYYFDSPAKGGGSDGKDMGAYDFTYGGVSASWTTIDFSTATYRNPDSIKRSMDALKLAEGVTENGATYSTFAAMKLSYHMTWEQNNDMPAAQLSAISTMYQSTADIQVDMGGGASWQDCMILRSVQFEYEEISGLYQGDGTMPTPVKELAIRLL